MSTTSGWSNALLDKTTAANRCVIWDKGLTEQRQRIDLFKTDDANEIQGFLRSIEIDEAASGRHCMCDGSPHIDVFENEKLLASIGMHHGVRLRCKETWIGDAELTRISAFELCTWLKDRGISGPWDELQQHVDQSLAYQRRAMAIQEILPEAFFHDFCRCASDEEIVDLFRSSTEDATELAAACLRILGCDNSSWNLTDEITHANALAGKVLPLLGKRAATEALRSLVLVEEDRDACFGTARALICCGCREVFEIQTLQEAFSVAMTVALQHPREENRRLVMRAVAQIEGAEVPLGWVLNSELTPASLSAEEAAEPAGFVFMQGLGEGEPSEVSDQAYAAWLLGQLGIQEARDQIARLAATADKKDKEVFEQALKELAAEGG